MSRLSDLAGEVRSGGAGRTYAVIGGLILLAVIYPEIVDSLKDLPLIGDFIPRTDSMVVMIVFTMMAVGLNVVVGYAGLLDLGYVAFYAAGAYTAGMVRLGALRAGDLPFPLDRTGERGRDPHLDVARAHHRGRLHDGRRHPDRAADPAAAR